MSPPAGDRARELAFTSYLRVLAMVGVVAIHVLAAIVNNPEIRGEPTWWIGVTLNRALAWSVPLFVMVSGALLLTPTRGESAGEFYRRRLRRIGIPLVVAHVAYFGVRATLMGQVLTPAEIVQRFLTATVFTQLYFFWIVLGLYLVTPPLRAFIAANRTSTVRAFGVVALLWMWAVTMGIGVLNLLGLKVGAWQPAALTLWVPYLGYFLLGSALRDLVVRPRVLGLLTLAFVAASAAVTWQFAVGRSTGLPSVVLAGGYLGMPVAIATLAVFIAGRSVIRPVSALAAPAFARPMRWLGDLTLGVFMIHPLLLVLLYRSPIFLHSRIKVSIPYSLLLLAVTLVLSFGICAVMARIPIVRRSIGL